VERVAFLLEDTGERIGCLLNPESVMLRRVAGVRPRRSASGALAGTTLADDPLLYTGGGRTELELELLFDVSLADATITTDDVRDLTRPLWELAENAAGDDGYGRLRLVRFVWGKSWNVPGVVAAVAERLEQFAPSGAPQRSWLHMRLWRVSELLPRTPIAPAPVTFIPPEEELQEIDIPPEDLGAHPVLGGGEEEGEGSGERLDEIAFRYYGDPALWRLLAMFNAVSDPLRLLPGFLLRIPPLSALGLGRPA
jgi:hypothetical protein